jgi:hypothetical protein
MSHKIKTVAEIDNPDRFRELVWANAYQDATVELLDEDGNVIDRATVEDGTISFERPEVSNEG